MQEVVGAVDRIDDPGPAAAAGHRGAFLTEDAVVGPAAPELVQDVGLRRMVGGRDHIRNRCFLPPFQAGLPHQQRQASGLADEGFRQLEVIQRGAEFGRAVPAEPVAAEFVPAAAIAACFVFAQFTHASQTSGGPRT